MLLLLSGEAPCHTVVVGCSLQVLSLLEFGWTRIIYDECLIGERFIEAVEAIHAHCCCSSLGKRHVRSCFRNSLLRNGIEGKITRSDRVGVTRGSHFD